MKSEKRLAQQVVRSMLLQTYSNLVRYFDPFESSVDLRGLIGRVAQM